MISLRTLLANVAFTLRLVRRSPAFYALVLVLLTVGIGATTAMFSVAESVLLKPLPYEQSDDLTQIGRVQLGASDVPTSAANFFDWRAQGTTFAQMAGVSGRYVNLSSEGTLPVSVPLAEVTADFFPMFRLKPLLGRLLGPDDDRPGAPLVAVISTPLWQSRFGLDPKVIGRTINLDSRPYTIVGVAPRGFTFSARHGDRVDLWIAHFAPYTADQYAKEVREARGLNTLSVMGRRRHGVSLAEAQAQMTTVGENLATAYPGANAKTGIYLRDLHDALVAGRSRSIWILLAAVGLVFVVISANVASLLLARAQARRGELATRAALGATSSALVLQAVTETVVLFGIASLLGGAVAAALVGQLAGQLLGPEAVLGAVSVHLDLAALLTAIGTSLLVGVVASAAPALVATRVDPESVLKETSVRASPHKPQARVRALLVVTQLALAFALLAGSGLAIKAFVRVLDIGPGFEPKDLATAIVSPPQSTYDTDDKVKVFLRKAVRAVGDLPGVQSAAATSSLPMSGSAGGLTFDIEGRPPFPRGEAPPIGLNYVSPGYFETMRIPILRGRDFNAEDTSSSRRVYIISKEVADKFFPGEDPIGHRIGIGIPFEWREIVGIVGDTRIAAPLVRPRPEGYMPFEQAGWGMQSTSTFFVVRTKTPEAWFTALPRVLQTVDAQVAVYGFATEEARIAGTVEQSHQMAVVLSVFALVSLLLATLGLFGLVSYTAAERTRELGIRLALGSSPAGVVRLVVAGAMKLVVLGLAIGFALSVWVGREVATVMPGGTAFDPAVVAAIPLVLGLAGLLACLLPALRAARTPPAMALRYE